MMPWINAVLLVWMSLLVLEAFLEVQSMPFAKSRKPKNKKALQEIVYPKIFSRGKDKDILVLLKTSSSAYYFDLYQSTSNSIRNLTVFGEQWDEVVDDERQDGYCRHYSGNSLTQSGGQAAFTVCNNKTILSGVILLDDGAAFLLHPISSMGRRHRRELNNTNAYVMFQPDEQYQEFCGLNTKKNIVEESQFQKHTRSRRSASKESKTIETAVYADYSLYKKFTTGSAIVKNGDSTARLRDTVLAIVNEVQLIYNYKSLRTKFKIVVVKLEILSENKEAPDPADGDIDQYLDNFCYWQSLKNPPVSSKDHWDHALMLTGLDLHKVVNDGQKNEKVLGLAWVNGMCRPQHSCTLNEGSSFEAAFVIAHEMGHSLGMLHDGRGNECDPNAFLMSEKTGPGKITWSTCSNNYLDKFFQKGFGSCLEDDNNPSSSVTNHEKDNRLPGERFPLLDQCKLSLGEQFKPHLVPKAPFNDVCRELWCVSGLWASVAHPALEGSECSIGKKCLQGVCTKTHQTMSSKPSSSTSEIVSDMKDAVSDFLDRLKSAFKMLTA